MAHFAKLNEANEVIGVEVIVNEVITDGDGVEQEQLGVDFLVSLYGGSTWKQTSYNTWGGTHKLGGTPLRKNYAAGLGYVYDATRDAFIGPQSLPSWILNEDTCQWQPPIDYPDDGKSYYWDDDAYQADNSTGWVEIE